MRIIVPEKLGGKRVDQALAELMPEHSRSAIARLIDEKLVTVDTQSVKRSTSVSPGQLITIDLPESRPTSLLPQTIALDVLFQDSDVAVIDKPAGLVVHPAAGHPDQTLVNALLHHLSDLSGVGGILRPGIVHRLDKDTSGLMVIAKNDLAHRKLIEQWGSELVIKEYAALVYGTPPTQQGSIEKPIGRHPQDRKKMAVVARGRPAVTQFRIERTFEYLSLLRCRLKTGRTHQIRVHLQSIGHPIVGDPVYAGAQWKGIPRKHLQKALESFHRQALHAAHLAFSHPRSGEPLAFDSPLPSDFAALLEQLV